MSEPPFSPPPPPAAAASGLEAFFSPTGPLAQAFAGFEVRQAQKDLAKAVLLALENRHVLVAEAGTGTGKTYAYLVPALLTGLKTIVSTGTKTLQDQLFTRDLPRVSALLGARPRIALLKGRASYLCPYHLERHRLRGASDPQTQQALTRLARFAKQTTSGDRAECVDLPEDAAAWALAISTSDNCLGTQCPEIKACFLAHARRAAMEADVVVINHHLFFADACGKKEGLAELLPEAQAVVFDEAHLLPEIASDFLGHSLTLKALLELVQTLNTEPLIAKGTEARLIRQHLGTLESAARSLREAFGLEAKGRLAGREALALPDVAPALHAVCLALETLSSALESQAARSEVLQQAQAVAANLKETGEFWLASQDTPEQVCWVDVFAQNLSLNVTPLDIAPFFQALVGEGERAWVFTSATLAVRGTFTHYLNRLGLVGLEKPVHTGLWESPFDYEKNALLYVPKDMPDPNNPAFTEAVAALSVRLIRANQGRAFVLCTSLRAMRHIHGFLETALAEAGLDYPLLLQTSLPKNQLLNRFRTEAHAVLVASHSFWEGVDVPGSALSLVIIDRLPFTPPDDPVLAARLEAMRQSGKNPFFDYQLPQATISLKQGAGRLIRSGQDQGVLCIADPRLVEKPYGRSIWQSLPAMKRTREEAQALQFLHAQRALHP